MRKERELKYWALRKWRWIRDNSNESGDKLEPLEVAIPELKRFRSGCSYCEEYGDADCDGCPFQVDGRNTCCQEFTTWFYNRSEENARIIIKRIQNVKVGR